MQLFKHNTGGVEMSEEAFRGLPGRILDLPAFYRAQHEWWRNKRMANTA